MPFPPYVDWISVKERMPIDSRAVLVYCRDRKNTFTANWMEHSYWVYFGGLCLQRMEEEVHYWMPLPPSPTEAQ